MSSIRKTQASAKTVDVDMDVEALLQAGGLAARIAMSASLYRCSAGRFDESGVDMAHMSTVLHVWVIFAL